MEAPQSFDKAEAFILVGEWVFVHQFSHGGGLCLHSTPTQNKKAGWVGAGDDPQW